MIRLLLSFFMIFVMVFGGTTSPTSVVTEVVTVEPSTIGYAVGDAQEGFVVQDVSTFDLLGADMVLLEHIKTRAQVLLILNDDMNRTFEITFKTPTENDMGVPHVFEHATLGGSEKYPSKSLFFNLIYQTYNTYLNAATYNFMTTYPMASLSEAQLLKYADYYLNACFYPSIYEDESIFLEEAWRYVLDKEDGDLTLAGTVYSEMQGAYDASSAAYTNFMKTVIPGSTKANVAGGIPASIPDMTWEDLKAYHDAYYRPSNSLTCIYGKIENPNDFLALMDSMFSAYEYEDIRIDDAGYEPIEGAVEARFAFGVEAGSDTTYGTTAFYGFVCGEADREMRNLTDMLTTILTSDASRFQSLMRENLPAASGSCYVDITTPELLIVFSASGLAEGEEEIFRKVVDDSIAQILENGFTDAELDAIAANYKLSTLLSGESASIGVNLLPTICYYWAGCDDLYGYFEAISAMDNFKTYAQDGAYAAFMREYLSENQRRAFAVTSSVAGLKEQEDAALAEKLAQTKANMTDVEIQETIRKTEEYNAQSAAADDGAQYVAQLQAVDVASLPEEIREYDILDETTDENVRYIAARTNTEGVGSSLTMLNASHLAQEDIHYFSLYTDLIGKLDTTSHTADELPALFARYLYQGSIVLSTVSRKDIGEYTPYLNLSFIALDEDMDEAYDLLYEMIYETKLDDAKKIAEQIASVKNGFKATNTASPYTMQIYKAYALSDEAYAYYNYARMLDYYAFLQKIEKDIATDPEAVLEKLRSVQGALNNRHGAISCFAGSEESENAHRAAIDGFFGKLSCEKAEAQEYHFPTAEKSEAFVVDSSVQYNMVYAPLDALGLEEYDGGLNVMTSVVLDTYLMPLLRDRYGVYGVFNAADEDGMYILSYRDSNIRETFEVYESLPELVSELSTMDDKALEGYILSAYSGYAMPLGELQGGVAAISAILRGKSQTDALEIMREIKSVTPESFEGFAELYRKIIENGIRSTSGAKSAIEANADLYVSVIEPFATVEAEP